MGPAAIVAGGFLAVSAYGTVKSVQAQKKQAKFQRQANNAQRQQDNLKAARERREAIRAARIARGASLQAGVTQGAEGSSAALGALGSIDSQLRGGLSFLDQYNNLSDQASIALGKANKQGAKAQTYGAVADFGMKAASLGAQVFGG